MQFKNLKPNFLTLSLLRRILAPLGPMAYLKILIILPFLILLLFVIQLSCIKSIFTFQKVRPKSTEDVVKIVNLARKHRVPIIPYSGATSLEGHFSGVSRLCFLHTVTSA